MNAKTIRKVNNVDIIAFTEHENRLVPIKPICDALGIAFSPQYSKIKNDEDLKSTVTLEVMVGSDKKRREMVCLPVEFIFGWLLTINPKNVKSEAKEFVSKYRMECFRVLADHFLGAQDFLKQKQEIIDRENELLKQYKSDFAQANKKMREAQKNIDKALKTTIEDWRQNNRQLQVFSDREQEGELEEETAE